MIFSAKIAALQEQVRDLEGKLNAATGNVEALTNEKAEAERQLSEANAKLAGFEGAVSAADHQAAIEAKDGELATVREQLEAVKKDTKTQIEKGTVAHIAKTGFPAIRRDPAAVAKDAPVKNDANKGGSPRERLAAGMKIDTGDAK